MPVNIAFLSAGLGNISRGFEISSSAWHDHIKSNKDVTSRLFSGGAFGASSKVWNCPRNGYITRILRSLGVIKDGCRLEQISFGFGFLFYLIFYKPDIIWLQEATLANVLLKWRTIFNFKYKILFCDGAPVGHLYADKYDYIIFLHKYAYADAIKYGINSQRCCVIPHLCFAPTKEFTRQEARTFLNVKNSQFVILCVAAWNKHHKRIDYLIEEVSKIKSLEVTLILCGQSEKDTPSIKKLAEELNIKVQWHTFSQDDLSKAYLASDLFVLPSLNEALGAVLIEAGIHGLPVICHPHKAGRYILGEDYCGLTDLSKMNNLYEKIIEFKNNRNCQIEGVKTKINLDERFNNEKLASDFLKFIKQISYKHSA